MQTPAHNAGPQPASARSRERLDPGITEAVAERARKLDGDTLRLIEDIARRQTLGDDDRQQITPTKMLRELAPDNTLLAGSLRAAHLVCEENTDVATLTQIENWIDETERRRWFLRQIAVISRRWNCLRPG